VKSKIESRRYRSNRFQERDDGRSLHAHTPLHRHRRHHRCSARPAPYATPEPGAGVTAIHASAAVLRRTLTVHSVHRHHDSALLYARICVHFDPSSTPSSVSHSAARFRPGTVPMRPIYIYMCV